WRSDNWRARERVQFERDQTKAAANLQKHGVSFQEARSVFGDPLATSVLDTEHVGDERRWPTTGGSEQGNLVIVLHTARGDQIRIIGARRIPPRERREYESGT